MGGFQGSALMTGNTIFSECRLFAVGIEAQDLTSKLHTDRRLGARNDNDCIGCSEMAQDTHDEFSRLWQRHLTVLRDDFSATSVQALPSLPSDSRSFHGEAPDDGIPDVYPSHPWDEKMNSVVDALDNLTLQSPNTTDTHSPGAPWFPDGEAYTETALSSPVNSSLLRTAGSSRNPTTPHATAGDYSEAFLSEPKGKGVETPDHAGTRTKRTARQKCSTVPFLLQRQFLYESNTSHPAPEHDSTTAAPTAATTALHTPTCPTTQKGPPAEVHVLTLTWAKHDRRGADGQLLSPGLDSDTETLRACLKRRGYRVQCRAIPRDYPTAAVETVLYRFLEMSAVDSLLVVYYHGYGNLDWQGRMVFWSGPGPDESSFSWDDVRDPIMQVPGDVLLVFDCTALPGAGAEQREICVEAGLVSSASTKQLLGVCVPSDSCDGGGMTTGSMPGDDMTCSLCRTLDTMADVPVLTVQRLCSLMREDLRGTDLAPRVFVSQLGGGQLLDIHLPRIPESPRATKHSVNSWF